MSRLLSTLIASGLSLPLLYFLTTSSSSPDTSFLTDLPTHYTDSHLAPPLETHTIVAVGDIHGSLQTAKKVLRMAGVIDEDGEWAMNPGDVLVQTGDILECVR